jgi:hypothetical protein
MIAPPFALPLARLTRAPRGWLPIVSWIAFALVAAAVERSRGSAHAADATLLGIFGAIALPLLAFGVVGAALGGTGLARAGAPLVSFGASPARAAFGAIGVSAVVTALLAAVTGASVAAIAHGSGDAGAGVARDVMTTAWVSGLGGIAYACLFALGAAFGKRGGGRSAALAADWILGTGTGLGGALTPRGHLRSLLGGDAVMALSGTASAVALVVLAATFAAIAVSRADR